MCLVSSLQPMTTTDRSVGTSFPRCWSSCMSRSIIPSPLTITALSRRFLFKQGVERHLGALSAGLHGQAVEGQARFVEG